MALIHPHLSLMLPASALLVSVAYQVEGHPSAILWGLGAALFLALPDLTHRYVRPFRSLASMHTWMAIATVVLGLTLASAFPLSWIVNGRGKNDDQPHFRDNHPDQIFIGLVSLAGLAITFGAPIIWRRHHASYTTPDHPKPES